MIADIPRWERQLIDLAQEGMVDRRQGVSPVLRYEESLEEAYELCERVIANHSRSFHFASRFLPSEKRMAIRALYAFCRVTDDLVDEPSSNVAAELESWRRGLDGDARDPIAVAWRDTCLRFGVPGIYSQQLIDGVGRDLEPARYESFTSLARYCYGVASTVGLMSMHIIGFKDDEAVRYAVKMGVALQLTNILRDVGEDLRLGRIYLPEDELEFAFLARRTFLELAGCLMGGGNEPGITPSALSAFYYQ